MKHITIDEAKARLAEIIEHVQVTGNRVTITDQGHPLVEIGLSLKSGVTPRRDEAFDNMVGRQAESEALVDKGSARGGPTLLGHLLASPKVEVDLESTPRLQTRLRELDS